jgi:hypothetical protein
MWARMDHRSLNMIFLKNSNLIGGTHNSNCNYFLIAKKWKKKKNNVKQDKNATGPFRPE